VSAAPVRVAILGSTGSIGRSALEVIARHPERFQVVTLAANKSVDGLTEQVRRFRPAKAVLCDAGAATPEGSGTTAWASGLGALLDAASDPDVDVVVNALVGAPGSSPRCARSRPGTDSPSRTRSRWSPGATSCSRRPGAVAARSSPSTPSTARFSSAWTGYPWSSVHRVVLTASGGPFRGRNPRQLWHVRPEDALQASHVGHGRQDHDRLGHAGEQSARGHRGTLPVRAPLRPDRRGDASPVDHPLLRGVRDGSVLAQLGFPTMELPIIYALSYPERVDDVRLRTYDPVRASPLTFEEIDHEAFPLFGLGCRGWAKRGGRARRLQRGQRSGRPGVPGGRISFPEMADRERSNREGREKSGTVTSDVLEATARRVRRRRRSGGDWVQRQGIDVMTILATVIVLGVLIFVHELGHFGPPRPWVSRSSASPSGSARSSSGSSPGRPSTSSVPSRSAGT
jgi:1-deoxy-D-xylulose-5-phosphate reductoisomerase